MTTQQRMPSSRSDLSLTDLETAALEEVRRLEQVRIAAIRANDAESMAQILDEKFIYINSEGKLFDRASYITAVRTHSLTYSQDLDLTETDYRVDGDVVILAGLMTGHARVEREQQVYHHRNMRVWRARGHDWKLLAWQSSTI
jgi:hypothetical protein